MHSHSLNVGAAMCALGLGAIMGSQGTQHSRECQCESLKLLDSEGRVRAELSVNKEPSLTFFNADGQKTLVLGTEDGTTGLLISRGGKVLIGANDDGAYLDLYTATEDLRLPQISLEARQGASRIKIRDGESQVMVTIGTTPFGPALTINGENGEVQLMLSQSPDGGNIALMDDSGKTIWSAPGSD